MTVRAQHPTAGHPPRAAGSAIWLRLAAATAVAALAACQPTGDRPRAAAPVPPAAAHGPIASEAAYRAQIVGRDLLLAPDTIARHSDDGTWLHRRANHITASGLWDWQGTLWCRSGTSDGRSLPRSCHNLRHDGTRLTITAPEGNSVTATVLP